MTVASEAWALALGSLPLSEGFRLRDEPALRYFPGSDNARFRSLCSIADLDDFLAGDAARTPRVILTDNSREGSAAIPYDEFTRNGESRVDLTRVHTLVDGGATLVVSQFHELHPPLARFCCGLEHVFLHPVQCNVYLTPAGAQGFRPHYDAHDVLILQVEGEKLWRYWPTPQVAFANTLTSWRPGRLQPDEAPREQRMRPGDVLYVPRGVAHDAAAQARQLSLHLTVGLLAHSWGDALRTSLYAVERVDPELRRTFPTWRLAEGGVPAQLVDEATERVAALASLGGLEQMAHRLLARLADSQTSLAGRGLEVPRITDDDQLSFSDAMHHFVTPRADGGADLHWAGEDIALTATEFCWISRLETGASARELGGRDAFAFCQRLAALGLVVAEVRG